MGHSPAPFAALEILIQAKADLPEFVPRRQFKDALEQFLICSGRLPAQGCIPVSLHIRAARLNSLFRHDN